MNYIKRDVSGIEISEYGEVHKKNTTMICEINRLCLNNLSTYEGRRMAFKKKYGISKNIPIFIDDKTCLLPLTSPRVFECVFVNVHQIKLVHNFGDLSCILFYDGSEINTNIKYKKILNKINKILKLLNNEKYKTL